MNITKCLAFLLIACMMTATATAAPLSKQQKKALKQQLGEYKKNPEAYQAMLDSYKKKIDKLESELKETEKLLKECRIRQVELEDSVTMMAAMAKPPAPVETTPDAQPVSVSNEMPANGPAFSVQCGYYELFNITEYFGSPKVFTYEPHGDGYKYVIRYFTDVDQAERFAEDVRALGINDAFVVHYLDGQRVTKEEFEKLIKGGQ